MCNSGNLLSPLGVREPGGRKTPETKARSPGPPPLSPEGRERRKAAPHCFPSPGRLEWNAMFSCFQLTSPHHQPSAFLRPGVKAASGESWGAGRDPDGSWTWAKRQPPGNWGAPSTPQDPSCQAPGLGTNPLAISQPLRGTRWETPHPLGRMEKALEASGNEAGKKGGWGLSLSLLGLTHDSLSTPPKSVPTFRKHSA